MISDKKPSCDQIIDTLPAPFVVIDRGYRILAANRAYLEHYGIDAGAVVGRHCHEVSHRSTVPCSQNGEQCPLETVLKTGQSNGATHTHFDTEGNKECVKLQAAPIVDDYGEVMYIGEYIQVQDQPADKDAMLVGRSPAFQRMTGQLQGIAPTSSTVLLLGESGVGKEKAAEYLHFYSQRSDAPLVMVSRGMLASGRLESELFGHEKGAVIGAEGRKIGLIESANGGSLFIDEVADLPLGLQSKLLRVLETGTFRRLGGDQPHRVDVRLIAASHHDLQRLLAAGKFRHDLYQRLSTASVTIPPLRQRREDIAALAEHFLASLPGGLRHIPLADAVVGKLLGYDFPGNILELRNILERALILADEDGLRPHHMVLTEEAGNPALTTGQDHLLHRRGRLTDALVHEALQRTNGHRAQAAQLLHVSERTLYRYIQRMRED